MSSKDKMQKLQFPLLLSSLLPRDRLVSTPGAISSLCKPSFSDIVNEIFNFAPTAAHPSTSALMADNLKGQALMVYLSIQMSFIVKYLNVSRQMEREYITVPFQR